MARVQSVLTYTLPATCSTPPPAPIRCGCNNLVLILDDKSLIRTELRGILEVEIKSVAASSAPVPYVDGSSGEAKSVWKYDYTVEYKDTDLTDPTYRIRKCDILFNCCYSCSQAYTDRQLEGYVQSVSGTNVNNDDPQNPVIMDVPADTLVNNGDRTFTHTSTDGTEVIFCQGIQSISAANTCEAGGMGAGYAIRSASFTGDCGLVLNGAPEHRSVLAQEVATIPPGGPLIVNNVTALIDTVEMNVPSIACRNRQYLVSLFGTVDIFKIIGISLLFELQVSTDGGAFVTLNTFLLRDQMQWHGTYNMSASFRQDYAPDAGHSYIARIQVTQIGGVTGDTALGGATLEINALGGTI